MTANWWERFLDLFTEEVIEEEEEDHPIEEKRREPGPRQHQYQYRTGRIEGGVKGTETRIIHQYPKSRGVSLPNQRELTGRMATSRGERRSMSGDRNLRPRGFGRMEENEEFAGSREKSVRKNLPSGPREARRAERRTEPGIEPRVDSREARRAEPGLNRRVGAGMERGSERDQARRSGRRAGRRRAAERGAEEKRNGEKRAENKTANEPKAKFAGVDFRAYDVPSPVFGYRGQRKADAGKEMPEPEAEWKGSGHGGKEAEIAANRKASGKSFEKFEGWNDSFLEEVSASLASEETRSAEQEPETENRHEPLFDTEPVRAETETEFNVDALFTV
ncbi:MAG TPA: hypothetical protein VFK27_06080, partial [Bacillales bacterium]|nr:hypothetical protein [Bacillales bacterium]